MSKRGQGEGSISKRSDGTWWARITVGKDENGKQKRKAFYGKTRKEVQEKLTAAINDINNDSFVDPSSMTLGKWIDVWLQEYKKPNLRISTYTNYSRYARLNIKPVLGNYKLKDLRNDMIQKWVNIMRENGKSAREINESFVVLSGAIKQAVSNDMLKKNVAERVILPKKIKPEIMALSVDEQDRLLEAIKNDTNQNNQNNEIFIMALGTGLRIGELLALTWDDINFDEPSVRVNKTMLYLNGSEDNPLGKSGIVIGPPKTKSSNRTVPLMPSLVSMLKGIKERQETDKIKEVTALKNLRMAMGCGTPQVEDKIDIPKSNLQNWEDGAKRPTIFAISKLAEFFDVPLSRLVDCKRKEVIEFLKGPIEGSANAERKRINARVDILTEPVDYEDGNYVFCSNRGKHLGACDLRGKFRKLCAKAGIRKGMHIHSLRHTFATRGLENGIELKVMQEFLGHASIKMTADIYTHVLPDQKANSIMKLEGMFKQ